MQIASAVGGFTLGESDMLRRAMGKKKKDVMDQMKDKFLSGAVKKSSLYAASAAAVDHGHKVIVRREFRDNPPGCQHKDGTPRQRVQNPPRNEPGGGQNPDCWKPERPGRARSWHASSWEHVDAPILFRVAQPVPAPALPQNAARHPVSPPPPAPSHPQGSPPRD